MCLEPFLPRARRQASFVDRVSPEHDAGGARASDTRLLQVRSPAQSLVSLLVGCSAPTPAAPRLPGRWLRGWKSRQGSVRPAGPNPPPNRPRVPPPVEPPGKRRRVTPPPPLTPPPSTPTEDAQSRRRQLMHHPPVTRHPACHRGRFGTLPGQAAGQPVLCFITAPQRPARACGCWLND